MMDTEQQRRERRIVVDEIDRRLDKVLSTGGNCELTPRIVVKGGRVVGFKFTTEDQLVLK